LAINKRKILESAQKHLQRGALDKALEDYRTLLKADPHDSNVLLKVGDLYLKQGKRDEAINSYLRVAQQFTREGFDAKAVALYKQISRLDPKRQDVCVPLSELYVRMGLVNDAIAALQGAADAAYRAGDKDGALELLRRMASLDPANTKNRLKVAELLAQEGRRAEAVVEYEAVAEELERRGENEERIRVLERTLAAEPERVPALLEVARAKLAADQFSSARKLAERLIVLRSDDVEGREILAHALMGEGDEERARAAFRELAELFRLRGDEGRARDLMQRFGELEALGVDDSDARLDRDVPVLELGDDAPIEGFLLDEDPAAPPAAPASAPAPTRAGTRAPPQLPAAEPSPPRGPASRSEAPRPAVAATPSTTPPTASREPVAARAATPEAIDPDQLMAEATVYLRYGKNERAAAALRTILAQDPGNREALESLGEALAARGETAHAVTAWQRAAEAARSEGDGEALARIRERLVLVDEAAAAALAPAAASEAEFEIDLDGSLEAIDDPTLAASSGVDLPPIDLDELDEALAAERRQEPQPEEEPELEFDGSPAAAALPPPAVLAAAEEEPTATTPARVAEDLEEAEFYFEQGLHDEARGLYERILVAAPNHAQAMLRLGEIAARSGAPPPAPAPRQSARPVANPPAPALPGRAPEPSRLAPAPHVPEPVAPRVQAEVTAPGLAPASESEIGDFDLAAELSDAIGSDEPSLRTLAGTEEEGFEEVFHAFKTGVERELGAGDHEARYDLGIAYKEMGLLEDAIAAFQVAMLAPARQLASLHMLGLCALELGRAADAAAHLEQALSVPELPADQRMPLRYDAGRAYAALGDITRARAAFEEVRAGDPSFGDVERELAALSAASEGAGDESEAREAYESFDELLAAPAAPVAAPRYESFEDLFGDDADDRPEQARLELAEPRPAAREPEPEPETRPEPGPARVDTGGPAESPPPPPAAEPAAPKRRRKISFV